MSEDLVEAREFGPYDLILESVGGRSRMLLICLHKAGCVSTLGLPGLNGTISERNQ